MTICQWLCHQNNQNKLVAPERHIRSNELPTASARPACATDTEPLVKAHHRRHSSNVVVPRTMHLATHSISGTLTSMKNLSAPHARTFSDSKTAIVTMSYARPTMKFLIPTYNTTRYKHWNANSVPSRYILHSTSQTHSLDVWSISLEDIKMRICAP